MQLPALRARIWAFVGKSRRGQIGGVPACSLGIEGCECCVWCGGVSQEVRVAARMQHAHAHLCL